MFSGINFLSGCRVYNTDLSKKYLYIIFLIIRTIAISLFYILSHYFEILNCSFEILSLAKECCTSQNLALLGKTLDTPVQRNYIEILKSLQYLK